MWYVNTFRHCWLHVNESGQVVQYYENGAYFLTAYEPEVVRQFCSPCEQPSFIDSVAEYINPVWG